MCAAAADADNVPSPERLDDPGAVAGGLVAVAQLAVVPLPPAVHLALHREGQAVLSPGVDGHLQCGEEGQIIAQLSSNNNNEVKLYSGGCLSMFPSSYAY